MIKMIEKHVNLQLIIGGGSFYTNIIKYNINILKTIMNGLEINLFSL